MTEDEYEYDPEQLQKDRQQRLDDLEMVLDNLKDRLAKFKEFKELRETMHSISQEKYEPADPTWEYQTDEDWLEAKRRFDEIKFNMNAQGDENRIRKIEQDIQEKESQIEQIKQEIEDNE